VPSTRRFAAPIAALALALTPTAALAQSAGDDQYTDPFGENDKSQGSGSSGGGSGSSGSSASGGSGVASSTSRPRRGSSPPSAAAVPEADEGGGAAVELLLAAGVVAAIGAGLVGRGLVLRRRTADARR
jgi:hypothetical protein